jgi:hypothetical protein
VSEPARSTDAGRVVFALAKAQRREPRAMDVRGMWPDLLLLAQREQAVIALRDYSMQHPALVASPEWAHRLALVVLDAQRRLHAARRRLEETTVALNAADVTPVLLKGAALAATVYGGWSRRSMRDIDILVSPEALVTASAAAKQSSWVSDTSLPGESVYLRHHHIPPLLDGRGSGLRLEIHRSPLPSDNPFRIEPEEIAAGCRPVAIGEGRALVMDPIHHAVHLAIHLVWSHELRAGAWNAFSDLHALLDAGQLDWPRLAATATRWRAGSCLYWTLRLARSLTGLDVPDEILRELSPAASRLMLDRLERHFQAPLLQVDAVCPPVRLHRTLWSAALQPRQQGHGAKRPWSGPRDVGVARGESPTDHGPFQLRQLSQLRQTLTYLTKLV